MECSKIYCGKATLKPIKLCKLNGESYGVNYSSAKVFAKKGERAREGGTV
jgi:hypothetical protein